MQISVCIPVSILFLLCAGPKRNSQRQHLAVALDLEVDGVADALVLQVILQRGGITDGGVIDGQHAVTRLYTGGVGTAALCDFDNVDAHCGDTQLLGGLGVGHIHDLDAQRGTSHAAVLDQLPTDLHGCVDGDRKADALGLTVAGLGIDNADQLAVRIEQAAAGVARADGRIGLDQRHIVVLHGDLTVQRTDDAIGDSVGQRAQRVADGDGAEVEFLIEGI